MGPGPGHLGWVCRRRRRRFVLVFFHPWLGGQFQLAKYACYQGADIETGQFHRDISRKFEDPGAIGAIWSPMVDIFRKLHFGVQHFVQSWA